MSFSNYLENKVLDKVLRNTDFTVTNAYASLHTADPGETGASEVSGGSYGRVQMEFDAASGGAAGNTNAEDFTGMPGVTVTHWGLWDASTAGNFLGGGPLTASKVINAGDTFRFPAGQATMTLD